MSSGETDISIVVVSGSMGVQTKLKGNIAEDELYHSRLIDLLQKKYSRKIIFRMITFRDRDSWYERLSAYCDCNKVDLVIFQLRSHDYIEIMCSRDISTSRNKLATESGAEPNMTLSQTALSKYRSLHIYVYSKSSGVYKVAQTLFGRTHRLILFLLLLYHWIRGGRYTADKIFDQRVHLVNEFADQRQLKLLYLA